MTAVVIIPKVSLKDTPLLVSSIIEHRVWTCLKAIRFLVNCVNLLDTTVQEPKLYFQQDNIVINYQKNNTLNNKLNINYKK